MNQAEFEHMKQVHDYVFSAPPNSPERDKRLAEINKEDDEKLWDFHCGLLSGRIKEPEATNKESEVKTAMNKEKKITSYEDFKKSLSITGRYKMLCEFKKNNPETYKRYSEKLEAERR